MKRKDAGFTLVELLVVIGIIGVLVALLFPAISGAMSSVEEVYCQQNLGQLAKAVYAYCQQSNGSFPLGATRFNSGSASDWLYVTDRSNRKDFDRGMLARGKYIAGHEQTRVDPTRPESPLRIADAVETASTQIFYCPTDIKRGLRRGPGALTVPTHSNIDRPPTSYVINASVTYGEHAWSTDKMTGIRARRIGEFDPIDFLFIEQSSGFEDTDNIGVPSEPKSEFKDAHMTAEPGKYALTNRHRNGGFVACIDGHVEWFHTDDFRKGMEKLNGNLWWNQHPKRPDGTPEGAVSPEEVASRWNPG